MKRILLFVIIYLAFCTYCFAEVTVDINAGAMTQEQRNRAVSSAYRIAYENGEDVVPTLTRNGLVFKTLTTSTQRKITKDSIIAEIAEIDAENAVNKAIEDTRISTDYATLKTELQKTSLSDEEIHSIISFIDSK